MRLATLRNGLRDGALVVVSRDGDRYVPPGDAVPTLQAALDDWPRAAPALAALADLRASCETLKVLGSYPRADIPAPSSASSSAAT